MLPREALSIPAGLQPNDARRWFSLESGLGRTVGANRGFGPESARV